MHEKAIDGDIFICVERQYGNR